MDKVQCKMYDALCELSGEEVARLFTNYYGNQLLNDEFYTFLISEEVIYED